MTEYASSVFDVEYHNHTIMENGLCPPNCPSYRPAPPSDNSASKPLKKCPNCDKMVVPIVLQEMCPNCSYDKI